MKKRAFQITSVISALFIFWRLSAASIWQGWGNVYTALLLSIILEIGLLLVSAATRWGIMGRVSVALSILPACLLLVFLIRLPEASAPVRLLLGGVFIVHFLGIITVLFPETVESAAPEH